jgi:hypothetical protein
MFYFLLLTKIGLSAQNDWMVNAQASKLGPGLSGTTFRPTP